MTKREKQIIKEHKQRMYDMRFMATDWQLTHQKRWDETTGRQMECSGW